MRNRVHRLLECQKQGRQPEVKNLFGRQGLEALEALSLPEGFDRLQLRSAKRQAINEEVTPGDVFHRGCGLGAKSVCEWVF